MLIHDLAGSGVAAIEYVAVARALWQTGDLADAITFFKDSLTAPPNDAFTRAEALRYLGGLYYSLGKNAAGHQYLIRAAHTFFIGHVLASRGFIYSTAAQAYLADAAEQLYFHGCRIAAADMTAAGRLLGSYPGNLEDKYFKAWDSKEYPLKCNGGG